MKLSTQDIAPGNLLFLSGLIQENDTEIDSDQLTTRAFHSHQLKLVLKFLNDEARNKWMNVVLEQDKVQSQVKIERKAINLAKATSTIAEATQAVTQLEDIVSFSDACLTHLKDLMIANPEVDDAGSDDEIGAYLDSIPQVNKGSRMTNKEIRQLIDQLKAKIRRD
jgi:hypothetical protein